MRCSAKRCTADPGPPQTVTVPGLQRTNYAPLQAAPRPGQERIGSAMYLSRRRFLYLAGAAGATSGASPRASAQAYPARPLRWIVGFPPGGGADIVSRIMAPWLAERIGQPVVVENKPGASSNISVQTVVNAPPDGYTLLFVPASAAVNVSLFDNLPFNLLRDIAPVS